jgi:hypothetical protein
VPLRWTPPGNLRFTREDTMRITAVLATLFAGVLATVLTASVVTTAQPAVPDDHDHEGKILTLSVITEAEQVAPASDDVGTRDHGGHGHTYTPDYDGYVPTSYGGDCYDGVLAYASWWSVGDWYIVYDQCEMQRYGAGQTDWDNVGRHEKAHTEGWGHHEEPRAYNAAFEPGIVICRC